jgi:hypothetical protein
MQNSQFYTFACGCGSGKVNDAFGGSGSAKLVLKLKKIENHL